MPSRKPSQTNELKNEKYEKEITKLKKSKNLVSSKPKKDSKNGNLASTISGGQNETVQLLTIIDFIQDTIHYHFIKLQRAIKNTIRLQSDPEG